MAKSLAIGIVIGATLGNSFNTTLGSATDKVTTLGSQLKELGTQQGLVGRFEKDQASLGKARLKLEKTQKEVMQLKLALRKDPDNAGLAQDLLRTQNSAAKLTSTVEKQRTALRSSEQDLQGAGFKVGNLSWEYTQLGQNMDKVRAKQQRLQKTMDKKSAASARLGQLKGQLMGMAGTAYAASRTIGEAMSFESAMADVRKVVDFDTPDGLIQLGSELKQMSRTIPITAEGLAQIAAAGGQLGVEADDLPQFTETVAKMATAFDMLPEQAGDAMAKLSNIYQIPVNEMDLLGDAINHLSDNSAAKARDIVPILARVGGTARQFGLSAVEVAALGGAFVALGKPPEVASTAINAMLIKLQTATRQGKAFQDGLSAIGMSAEDLEQSVANNAQGALSDFLETLSQIDDQERAGVLADMFGMEYADDVSLLAGSLDQYRDSLGLVAKQEAYAGSMQKEFAARSATTANELQLMKNKVSGLAINLGSTLLPAINSVLKPVGAVTNWAADMVEKFPWIGRVVGGVAAGLGVFVGGLTAVTAATWLWNAALLANPIGLTVAAIGGAAALVMTFWEPITGFFSDMWDDIEERFSTGVGILTTIWEFSPLGLLFTAQQKLASFVGGIFGGDDEDKVAPSKGKASGRTIVGKALPTNIGKAVAAAAITAAVAAPVAAADLDKALPANNRTIQQTTTITSNPQITITQAPGQDPEALGAIVAEKLRDHEQRLAAQQRGNLYD
jgi:TP901 family phage tail tape measure protein